MASYKDFYEKRKELQRLRNIYNQRVKRAKAQGLYNATYLSKINNLAVGLEGDGTDSFPLDKFLEASAERREQMLRKITRRTEALESKLANRMSSVRGIKEIIKRDVLGHYPTTNELSNNRVSTKLQSLEGNLEGNFKHEQVKDIMDRIDSLTNLTYEEKETLKKYIRRRLDAKERVDYDDAILEWDFDVDDILENPEYFLQQLNQEVPEEELRALKEAASKLALGSGNVPF